MVKELFLEFLSEADTGKVRDGKYYYGIHIHTKYCEDDIPVLHIKNEKLFYEYLEEYFKMIPLCKSNMAWLFINMTTEDFNNPENYIRRNIEFLKNKLLEDKEIENIESLFDSNIEVSVEKYYLETPYSYNIKITNDIDYYLLPSISYGIDNNTCYIYAVFDKNSYDDNAFSKKIKRRLYSLNKGIKESEEYIQYKNGADYYPENISDVSPSAILSLAIFLDDIYKHGITKVCVVPYLPIRYNDKREHIVKRSRELFNKDKVKTYQEAYETIEQEQLRIQNNLTQKLIRNFLRLKYHFNNIDILSFPYELDEFMHFNLSEFTCSNNELLNELISVRSCIK